MYEERSWPSVFPYELNTSRNPTGKEIIFNLAFLNLSNTVTTLNIRLITLVNYFSRVDFLNRVKRNEQLKREAKQAGKPAPECKRIAKQVIPGHVVVAGESNQPQFLAPIPYEFVA